MCGVSAELSFSKARLQLVAKWRAGQRFEQRPAEIQRAQLGQRQTRRQPLERLAIQRPPRLAVVSRAVVVDRKTGLLERLQIAPYGAGRDLAPGGEIVNRHTGVTGALDLAQDRPLADDFGVPRHRSNCSEEGHEHEGSSAAPSRQKRIDYTKRTL